MPPELIRSSQDLVATTVSTAVAILLGLAIRAPADRQASLDGLFSQLPTFIEIAAGSIAALASSCVSRVCAQFHSPMSLGPVPTERRFAYKGEK